MDTKNMHWKFTDEIYKNGELIDVIHGENIVCTNVIKLIGALMGLKESVGVQYWAVGSGDSAWDAQWASNPPTPSASAIKLNNEIFRLKINASDIKFVDENGTVLADNVFSNRIQITAIFTEAQGNGDWREFGIFAGTSAIATKDSGIMIDFKYHKMIPKTADISITRKIILEF